MRAQKEVTIKGLSLKLYSRDVGDVLSLGKLVEKIGKKENFALYEKAIVVSSGLKHNLDNFHWWSSKYWILRRKISVRYLLGLSGEELFELYFELLELEGTALNTLFEKKKISPR